MHACMTGRRKILSDLIIGHGFPHPQCVPGILSYQILPSYGANVAHSSLGLPV